VPQFMLQCNKHFVGQEFHQQGRRPTADRANASPYGQPGTFAGAIRATAAIGGN
jgi:hypothetical protein